MINAKSQTVNELYSKKQQEVLSYHYNNDYFMLINSGAVRTGKTFIDNDIFIAECLRISEYAKDKGITEPQYILAGASLGTLKRNILSPLTEKYGIEFKFDNINRFKLFGVVVCCFGHDDIGNITTITGMTSFGAYINEATIANNEVFDEIIKRCSGAIDFNARIIMDTNPSSPAHPLYQDYILKADGKRVKVFYWTLNDNPYISKSYVDNLKATTPSGVFYNRKILGLWVSADGVVYEDFDSSKCYVDNLDGIKFTNYYAGVDWGYEHYGSIVIFGETDKGITIMLDEVSEKHCNINWWIASAKALQTKYSHFMTYFCDSARPEYVKEFALSGLNARNADKSVLAGIGKVGGAIKSGKLLFYRPNMKRFNEEIYTYVWATKKDEPKKENDDVMDAMRYGYYAYNNQSAISKIQIRR